MCRSVCSCWMVALLGLFILNEPLLFAADWPMLGRDRTRNAVSPEKDPPTDWDIKTGKNILWKVNLGNNSMGVPVVAKGLVWAGTNNVDPRNPKMKQDASVLMCFNEKDGKFRQQFLFNRLTGRQLRDWTYASFGSSPLIEGERMWFVNNRCETICMNIAPLYEGKGAPKLVWKVDMKKKLDTSR